MVHVMKLLIGLNFYIATLGRIKMQTPRAQQILQLLLIYYENTGAQFIKITAELPFIGWTDVERLM
jgi:hypothetical protein